LPADKKMKVKRAPQNKNPFGKDAKKSRTLKAESSKQVKE
jgi:hypothetical protein